MFWSLVFLDLGFSDLLLFNFFPNLFMLIQLFLLLSLFGVSEMGDTPIHSFIQHCHL